jgi:hypothetical protein
MTASESGRAKKKVGRPLDLTPFEPYHRRAMNQRKDSPMNIGETRHSSRPRPFRVRLGASLRSVGWRRPLLALASLLVSAELIALTYHLVAEDRFFYLEGRPLTRLQPPAEYPSVAGRLHPYFGFVALRPEAFDDLIPFEAAAEWRPNNHGFLSAVGDYPVQRGKENRRFVGVFGGSVALQCALHLSDDPGFMSALRSDPRFADREIVVLNFAQPGYKQPQQLLILGYMLALGQDFDLVINIDGFNEVALAQRNIEDFGIDPSLPTGSHLSQLMYVTQQASLDSAALETLLARRRLQERRQRVAAWHDASPSASLAFLLTQEHARLVRREQAMGAVLERSAIDALDDSMLSLAPADPAMDQASAAQREAEIWAASSVRMHALLQAEGVDYIHLLQPNQYFSNHRFSEAEAAIALRDDHPYRAPAARGYPQLIAALPALRAAGVTVIDGVGAFDEESRRVYADDCCHYNPRGLEIISEMLSEAIPLNSGRFPASTNQPGSGTNAAP